MPESAPGLTADTPDIAFASPERAGGESLLISYRGRKANLAQNDSGISSGKPLCLEARIAEFRNQVDREYAAAIYDTRKKLGLSQKTASDLFGGGVNAFSRYELGKSTPPLSLVVLFYLLEKHPDLLDEVRDAFGVEEAG